MKPMQKLQHFSVLSEKNKARKGSDYSRFDIEKRERAKSNSGTNKGLAFASAILGEASLITISFSILGVAAAPYIYLFLVPVLVASIGVGYNIRDLGTAFDVLTRSLMDENEIPLQLKKFDVDPAEKIKTVSRLVTLVTSDYEPSIIPFGSSTESIKLYEQLKQFESSPKTIDAVNVIEKQIKQYLKEQLHELTGTVYKNNGKALWRSIFNAITKVLTEKTTMKQTKAFINEIKDVFNKEQVSKYCTSIKSNYFSFWQSQPTYDLLEIFNKKKATPKEIFDAISKYMSDPDNVHRALGQAIVKTNLAFNR